jgi:hypothetical protein
MPPASVTEAARFAPAPEVLTWVREQILAEDGALHNADHAHLLDADLQMLWAPASFEKQGRVVVGTAEQVAFRAGGFQRMRQETQMLDWFGRIPDYLITLSATYCLQCSDAEFCALVEHELYHVAHQRDEFGTPAFDKEGRPKMCLRGHDVEEFVGVVRRYGVGRPDGALSRLVRAAGERPEVNLASIAGACGTCLLRAA